jgi:sulfite reductase beta subunit-like hemoprotein
MFAVFALPNPDDSRPISDALYSVAATVQVDLQLTANNNSVVAPQAVRPIAGTAQVGEVVDLIKGHMKDWSGNAALAFEQYLENNVRAAGLDKFAQDVRANMAKVLIPSPQAVSDLRTADSADLRSPQGIFVS